MLYNNYIIKVLFKTYLCIYVHISPVIAHTVMLASARVKNYCEVSLRTCDNHYSQ